jgi:hypothetical protein
MTEPILRQIERYAPGFRDRILATTVTTPAQLEAANPNDRGGDITGGRMDLPPAVHPAELAGPRPVRDLRPSDLPLLGVDAARRRDPRDVGDARGRLARRATSGAARR